MFYVNYVWFFLDSNKIFHRAGSFTGELAFGKGSVRIPASTPARLTEDFRCFLQLIQQIIEIASLLCNDRFLLNTSSSLSYHSTGVSKLINIGVAYDNFGTSGEQIKEE